jgi:hypothetical protein
LLGDLGDTHPMLGVELIDEARLLQQMQALNRRAAQQLGDPGNFIASPGNKGHGGKAEFAGATVTLEPIEQNGCLPATDSLERLLNASFGDGGQKPLLQPRLREPVALVTQV